MVTLLPVVGVGSLGSWLLVQREIQAQQSGTWARTRALTTGIDAELGASIAALRVLAASPALAGGDLAGFQPEALRALRLGGARWLNLLVSDGHSGALRLSVHAPQAQPLRHTDDVGSVLAAARSGRAMVSPLLYGEGSSRFFAVRVPVAGEGGAPALVVSAVMNPAFIEALMDAQEFPPQWTAAVVDGHYNFISRRPSLPGAVSPSLRQALDRPTQGWTQGRLMDGQEVYRTVQRSTMSGWSVAVAIPKAEVEQSLRDVYLLWLGFGTVLSLCLWLAWWLARGVSQPIATLAAAAPALGRGEPLVLPATGQVQELRLLCDALQQASARLREREADREAAETALRAANRAKDEFLAMLGHELRNPLSSLANASELLQRAGERPEVVPMVAGVLARQVHQMARLVDDLLEVGRVTAGKIRLLPEPMDLAEAARATLATLAGNGRCAAHRVDHALQPAWVQADGARLEQIIANLMDNALKYTPAGGHIHIDVRREGADAVLEVQDNGQGMPPELARSAFDLFVQGERGPSRESGGLGIGLTLAQRLAQLHGGEITAASPGPGLGSTFTLRLPAIQAPAAAATEASPGGGGTRRRVLVVEDNVDAGESLVALLDLLGHQAEWTGLGEAGVARATALLPDLVLVDVGLPDIDGHEVARRLRAQPATQALRLVALTGYGTPEDRERALAAGFDDHLAKPIGLPELEALLAG
jgi:signal transduction histidine kinase